MNDLETNKKKIIYKASHRGSKEMDILLGNFINKYIDLFNENELNLFDSILECDDEDIYQWILGKKDIPENYSNRTLQLLINTTQNLR
jgi:antitoxin CptB|tara:strand:+ start:800 stop:1063 length:264 start_codon:yes stop_codon:yes gene_type:complete